MATLFHYSSFHPEDRSNGVSLTVRKIDRRRTQFTAGKISTLQLSVGICKKNFKRSVASMAVAYPASCTRGTGSFLGVKSGRGVTLTPHPLLVPLVMKE